MTDAAWVLVCEPGAGAGVDTMPARCDFCDETVQMPRDPVAHRYRACRRCFVALFPEVATAQVMEEEPS